MPRFSLSVPAWLADVLVPPLLLGLFVAFVLGWRHATTPSVTLASFRAAAILTAAYAVGYLAALKLRALLGRAALRRWGGLVAAVGVLFLLFSFGGLRPLGAPLIGLGLGLLVGSSVSQPNAALHPPSRGRLAYLALVLAVPLALTVTAAVTHRGEARWTTLALFDLFFTGFVAWSLLRYHAPESALFSATFCAFWGIIGGWIFGPLLLVGIAGFGGVAATASWLWEGDATGAPGAPVPVA